MNQKYNPLRGRFELLVAQLDKHFEVVVDCTSPHHDAELPA